VPPKHTHTRIHGRKNKSSSGSIKLAIETGGGEWPQIFELAPGFKANLSCHTVFEVIKLKRADAVIIQAVGFNAGL